MPLSTPGAGQISVRVEFVSIEPAMRGWLTDTTNYAEPVAVGDVMRSLGVGEVIASNASGLAVGDIVLGWLGWQEFAVIDSAAVIRRVTEPDLPTSLALGVLGINGVTAYLALNDIGQPKPGESVLVTTAAGAVGSAAGQIAKRAGARVVGVAGGPVKVALCQSGFGFDAAVDYRDPAFEAALRAACPYGVDVFFDNTGGPISDTVYPLLNIEARVIVCGTAATASWEPWPQGARLERHILTKRLRVSGFVIFDHMARWEDAVQRLADLVREGGLAYREEVLEGLDVCPGAIAGLYRGENLGKRLVRL